MEQLLGRRPGDAMLCANADQAADGCGSSKRCSLCPLGRMLSESERSEKLPLRTQCRIKGATDISLELVLNKLPGLPDELRFLTLIDQSEFEQQQMLNRTFFHDLINVAGGIQGMAEVLDPTSSRTQST